MALELDPFDAQDHSRDVVVYKAIVRFAVEESTMWLNPVFTGEEREGILDSPLRMNFRGTWPPGLTSDIHRNVQVLAYTRMFAGMSVMNNSKPHSTPAEFRQSIYDRQPTMDPDLYGADREEFQSWKVSVAISEQGLHTVTISPGSPGRVLPALHFPDYLHKLVELALLETIVALAAWPRK